MVNKKVKKALKYGIPAVLLGAITANEYKSYQKEKVKSKQVKQYIGDIRYKADVDAIKRYDQKYVGKASQKMLNSILRDMEEYDYEGPIWR